MKLPSPERTAQAAIILLFVIIIRSLGEYFRLEHAYGYSLPRHMLSQYVGGALIATVATAICVIFYFARRYRSVTALFVIAVIGLLFYKIHFIH
ncbi:MAG TPA: hypothetical protein VGL89_09230 [Candidatus Koribacter sp.]